MVLPAGAGRRRNASGRSNRKPCAALLIACAALSLPISPAWARPNGDAKARQAAINDANAGLAALQAGDNGRAVRLFTQALGSGALGKSDRELALLKRAEAFLALGDRADALADAQAALALAPDDDEARAVRDRASQAAVAEVPAPPPDVDPVLAQRQEAIATVAHLLEAHGRLNYVLHMHYPYASGHNMFATKPKDTYEDNFIEYSNAAPDSSGCALAFDRQSSNPNDAEHHLSIQFNKINAVSMGKYIILFTQMTKENDPNDYAEFLQPLTSVYLSSLDPSASVDLLVADEAAAKVMVEAAHRAAKLCGGMKD